MRVSAHFNLGQTQPTLDFVDIDIAEDTAVFISPKAIELLPSEWGERCVHLIQSFFQTVLEHIKAGRDVEARRLLQALREPNETHLGLSKGKSQGRALGSESARNVWQALSQSEAARSGLLEDLEDTVLMIEGISVDIVSDIATNIIRQPLIEYTQEMAEKYGILLNEGISSGPMWDAAQQQWFTQFVNLPTTPAGKLLLVPKIIVRRHLEYDADEYYRHFLLEYLREIELAAGSSLVELLKNKKRRVTKKALTQKYGSGKAAIVRETLRHPEVLDRYRKAKASGKPLPLNHDEMAEIEGGVGPDWDALLSAVTNLSPGTADASAYERAIEGLLTALFYPDLTNPRTQHQIHIGRMRIDVTYTNIAISGFFKWIATHYPAAQVFIECKNYTEDIANNELDQIAGRFSPSRGQIGIIVCRTFENKALFLERCRDTAKDNRGFILVLDDADLATLCAARQSDPLYQDWAHLRAQFQALID